MTVAMAQKVAERAGARLNRITRLEKKLETSKNPVRQVWLRHLIDRNERKFDKAVAPHINENEMKGTIAALDKPFTFFELREVAAKDYLKAWEKALDDAERKFITEGKIVPPGNFFIKPRSVERYEDARHLLAMEMQVDIPRMDLSGARAGGTDQKLGKSFMIMTVGQVVGAAAGYAIFHGFWGTLAGYAVAFACATAIAGYVGGNREA